jgi:hypothetical protein
LAMMRRVIFKVAVHPAGLLPVQAASAQTGGCGGPVRVPQQRPGGFAVLEGGGGDPITPGHPGSAAAGISVQLC